MKSVSSNESTGIIALCDDEPEYVFHLAEYLKCQRGVHGDVRVFTGSESLLSHLAPGNTALLVISESAYTQEVKEEGFPLVLVLNESGRYMEAQKNISKYQSMDVVTETILSMCAGSGACSMSSARRGGPMKIIGFYTPCKRSLQTLTSLVLADVLGEKSKVLYLNFEPFSGFLQLHKENHKGNFRGSMTDLLYFCDTAKEKVAGRLSMITEKLDHVEYVPPFSSFQELVGVEKKEWLALLAILSEVTDYGYLVLDLSECVEGLLDILGQCSRIVTIAGSDHISQAKLHAYQDFLTETEADGIVANTDFVNLPRFDALPQSEEALGRGELAFWVRDRIRNRDERL